MSKELNRVSLDRMEDVNPSRHNVIEGYACYVISEGVDVVVVAPTAKLAVEVATAWWKGEKGLITEDRCQRVLLSDPRSTKVIPISPEARP